MISAHRRRLTVVIGPQAGASDANYNGEKIKSAIQTADDMMIEMVSVENCSNAIRFTLYENRFLAKGRVAPHVEIEADKLYAAGLLRSLGRPSVGRVTA